VVFKEKYKQSRAPPYHGHFKMGERRGGEREEERDVLFRHGSFISKSWFTLRKRRVEKIVYIYQQFRIDF